MKDPSVVLLDEPTSGLDQNTEMQVLAALREWIGNKTMIVVTHRPQLLDLVDRIIVMEQGQIVMDGPKAAVLAQLSGKAPSPQQAQHPAAAHNNTVKLADVPVQRRPQENI